MTTIFYTNSFGITAQWKGEVIAFDETSISIKFSKNKALKYRLKDLGIDFVLVTKTLIKKNVLLNSEVLSFDEKTTQDITEQMKGNTAMLWTGKEWAIS